MDQDNNSGLIGLTSDIVVSYLENNSVQPDQIAGLIKSVHSALSNINTPVDALAEAIDETKSRVEIRKSITGDHLISFVDGKPYRTLKRHLAIHGMTPDEYKARFGLPSDYPIVAPDYSAKRSELAKKMGLGAGGRGRVMAPAPKAAPKARRAPATPKAPTPTE